MSNVNNNPSPLLSNSRICFYGAGSMAEAIVRGILNKGLLRPQQVSMINRSNTERLLELEQQYSIVTRASGHDEQALLQDADIIVLAMKPKDAAKALKQLSPLLHSSQLIISVIAGISIASIKQLTSQTQAVIRAMPNTSSTIGLGATGISHSKNVSDNDVQAALAVFDAIGVTVIVEEQLQPAVTAVSGSGPAYVYQFMEAMISGAQSLGLSLEQAKQLVYQTVQGAAAMVQSTGEEPQVLRQKVTSPNGTTEAALNRLTEENFSDIIQSAMKQASSRAIELGAEIERSISQ